MIDAQRAVCTATLATMRAQADQTPDPFPRLVFAFRCSQMQACLDWLDVCAATLAHLPSAHAAASGT